MLAALRHNKTGPRSKNDNFHSLYFALFYIRIQTTTVKRIFPRYI